MVEISIIMPLFNAEKFLEETLKSIEQQNFKEYELICINDKSTDSTLNILEEELQKNKNIKIIYNAGEKGAANSRNLGLKHANGEYICFLDGDDIYDEDMLSEAYIIAKKHDADIVIFPYIHVNSGDIYEKKKISLDECYKRKYCQHTFNIKNQATYDWCQWSGSPCNKLFKSELIKKHKIQFQNLPSCNDVYFVYMALFLSDKTIALDSEKIMLYAREHEEPSRISINRNPICIFQALEFIEENFCKRGLIEKYAGHFFYLAFFLFIITLENNEGKESGKNFYNFLQAEGIKRLQEKGMANYQLLSDRLKGYYQNFIILPYDNGWYRNHSVLDEFLMDNGEVLVKKIKQYKLQKQKIAFWGVGKNGQVFLRYFNKKNIRIDIVIDRDSAKWEKEIEGYCIKSENHIVNNIDIILTSNKSIYCYVEEKMRGKNIDVIDVLSLLEG